VLAAVIKNLSFDQHLLNSDGTADTSLSKRQDYGSKSIPLGLSASYLQAAHISPEHSEAFSKTAHFIWNNAALAHPLSHTIFDLNRLVNALFIKQNDTQPPIVLTKPQLADFAELFPTNRFWRTRQGAMTASVFADRSQLLNLNYHTAELAGIKINQAYFGAGKFVGDTIDGDANGVTLTSNGQHTPRRPGYDYALGPTAAKATWDDTFHARPLREVSPASGSLSIQVPNEGLGLDLNYKTTGETQNVATQVAFDFAPGGIWETDHLSFVPDAGQVIFLKEGSARMRYGIDIIEISGGAHSHTMWAMRDSETAPNHVRILITFQTPVDHSIQLRCYRSNSQ